MGLFGKLAHIACRNVEVTLTHTAVENLGVLSACRGVQQRGPYTSLLCSGLIRAREHAFLLRPTSASKRPELLYFETHPKTPTISISENHDRRSSSMLRWRMQDEVTIPKTTSEALEPKMPMDESTPKSNRPFPSLPSAAVSQFTFPSLGPRLDRVERERFVYVTKTTQHQGASSFTNSLCMLGEAGLMARGD